MISFEYKNITVYDNYDLDISYEYHFYSFVIKRRIYVIPMWYSSRFVKGKITQILKNRIA